MTQRQGIRIGYAAAAFIILIAEVLIALYVRDAFIRPYGGDILVTLLICCVLRVVWPQRYRLPIAGGVLVFAILVEVGQYFGLVDLLGLGHVEFFRIIIGTGFSWWDMLCYAVGCGIFAAVDSGMPARRRS